MKVKNPEVRYVVQQTLLYLGHLGRLDTTGSASDDKDWDITEEDDYEDFIAEIGEHLYA